MKASTPPKHKTPNYRLVNYASVDLATMKVIKGYAVWEPMPLRANRKDL
jgi:hypothetical protein